MPMKNMNNANNNVALSNNIECDERTRNLLAATTVEVANIVVNEIDEEEPGLFVQITNQNNLHAALALAHSPVPQGVDADSSLAAFREWLIEGALNVDGGCHVPANSDVSLAFHHIKVAQAFEITNGRWIKRRWNTSCEDHGIREFAIVFLLEGTGRHRSTISVLRKVFSSH